MKNDSLWRARTPFYIGLSYYKWSPPPQSDPLDCPRQLCMVPRHWVRGWVSGKWLVSRVCMAGLDSRVCMAGLISRIYSGGTKYGVVDSLGMQKTCLNNVHQCVQKWLTQKFEADCCPS